jgi:hypothetical protein
MVETSKTIPKDTEMSPSSKKGDNRWCSRHRGIFFWSRWKSVEQNHLGNRTSSWQLRQTAIKSVGYYKESLICFVDLQEAFKSVQWHIGSGPLSEHRWEGYLQLGPVSKKTFSFPLRMKRISQYLWSIPRILMFGKSFDAFNIRC